MRPPWRLDLGARVSPEGTHFRVWASKPQMVEVVLEPTGTIHRLEQDNHGYWFGLIRDATAGMTYRYRLNGKDSFPDPCSRFQPEGPHGPSLIVDPSSYRWRDQQWRGIELRGQVIYELHIGTFTPDGTFDSAVKELDELKRLGITVIEVMPVGEFSGRWNWGYDGVDLYAPAHVYGDHEALKRFVDEAHARGLAVILDVVYNHIGPDGNYLSMYSAEYFTDRHGEWGQALNFDGPGSESVREFFVQNACYWINEFHLDGLRLDAVHAIHDDSPVHVMADLSRHARLAAGDRSIILVAECDSQLVACIRPIEEGGWGLDGIWSEDFHHAARVAATGRAEGYYIDYRGTPQELISAVKRGFLYQGQRSQKLKKARGTVVGDDLSERFVFYIQNHDQVANQLWGDRLHMKTSPGVCRALTALLLLAPATPLLFMGQEFGASAPFLFFTDFSDDELKKQVYQGRKQFLAQFPSFGSPAAQAAIPDPSDPSVFQRSKLDLSERQSHAEWYALHQDLLRLRREDPIIARQARDRMDGAVIGPQAFVLRYEGDQAESRLLVINLGPDLRFVPAPEPLLAPPPRAAWTLAWSSEAPRYGGQGIVEPWTDEGWVITGGSASFMA
jgi:maltooligosyltrehalose trehalohydrolase